VEGAVTQGCRARRKSASKMKEKLPESEPDRLSRVFVRLSYLAVLILTQVGHVERKIVMEAQQKCVDEAGL
jgi:hypothetical protein